MSTAASPPNRKPRVSVRPADRQDAIKNLVRETMQDRDTCARAYDAAGCDFRRALGALQAARRADEEREAERVFQQCVLRCRAALILPQMRRFMKHAPKHDFNPLANPLHAYWFLSDLPRRGVAVELIPEGDCTRVRLTARTRQGWVSGEGVSDVLGEALTFAWNEAFGEDVTP